MAQANTLRKWLKKEAIFDTDVEQALIELGINNPEEDFKSVTQSQWDDLYRKCVVERAKDLKDAAAKSRLEKKMTKLEKYWRKASGIKATSITKKGTTKDKKANTNASAARNSKAMKESAALKKYLKTNQVFDADLVLILSEMGIKSEEELSVIDSNSKYDEIVRQMRVIRSKDLKDSAARGRLDKLLTKFEKLWRAKTGIKKKTSGGEKAKKKESSDTNSSEGNALRNWMKENNIWEKTLFDELQSAGINSADDLNQLSQAQFDDLVRRVRVDRFSQLKDAKSRQRADKLLVSLEKLWRKSKKRSSVQPSGSADDKDSEILPWYLSGKQKNAKTAIQAGAARTPAQKKKDNKVLNKMRDSAKLEQEWIAKYTANKEKHEQKVECKAEDIDFGDMVVDVCLEMLLTLHESWEGRVSIVNALFDQLCAAENDDVYAFKMCKFLLALGHQFTDPRSLIIQAMQECVTRLAKETPERFIFFAPYILSTLFVTFPVRIEALRDPGVQLGKTLVQQMSEYDTDKELLKTICQGLSSKHAAIRTECADYIDYVIRKFGVLEKEDASEQEQALLAMMDDAVKKACKDAAAEARMNGYRALNQYKTTAPNAAQAILEKMTAAQMEKYEQANQDQHYE